MPKHLSHFHQARKFATIWLVTLYLFLILSALINTHTQDLNSTLLSVALFFLFVIIGVGIFAYSLFFYFTVTNLKSKKTRPQAIRYLLFSFFVIIMFFAILVYFLAATDFASTKDSSLHQDSTQQTCDEQLTLQKAKACTIVIVAKNRGHGTGFSISPGYIVTNKHVIEGAGKLTTWINGEEKPLTVWNYSDDDLAVLKIDTNIPPCDWADSDKLAPAETLYAIGWPLDPTGESSITKGIYSRSISTEEGVNFIQTDTTINPGNSGGPLINKCGIVGINNKKAMVVGVDNFGLAISSNYAKDKITKLIQTGSPRKAPQPARQKRYTPKTTNTPQFSQTSINVQSWIKARSLTNEMINYWNNVNPGEYDQSKLTQLKDLLARMKAALDVVVPKLEKGQSLTQAEQQLLSNWNNMFKQVIRIEGELDGHSYSNGYYHYECRNYTCTRVGGRGKDKCSSYSDCAKKYHYACVDMSCQYVEGDGPNECLLNSDCSHSVCENGTCKQVPGKGNNECYINSDCYHNECQNGQCVRINTPGTSTCYTDYFCQ